MDKKTYSTIDEAIADRVLCETCDKPQRSLGGNFSSKGNRYTLDPCDMENCNIHCQGHK